MRLCLFIYSESIIQMSTEYERLMREYQIPPGALTPEQLKLLAQGGIRLDDSDDENQHYPHMSKQTKPKLPNMGNININSSSVQNQALKQIYQNQISKRDKQIWYLQNESSTREKMFEAQKNRLDQQYQIQIEKVLAQLRRARAQVIHSEGQLPLIKQALNKVREMLSGMESETVYLRIKDIPERDLPPSEWLLVNVWELVYPYKKQMEFNRKQTTKLRQDIKMMNDKQHSLLNQLDHYQRLLNSKDDDGKRYALNYENNRKCLELQIDKLREECEILREKGARYDELYRDYQLTKQEKEMIQEKMGFYDRTIKAETSGGNGSKFSADEQQRRKIDLLTQDKEYLTKQNIQLIQKERRLQDRLDRLEAQLLSAKNQSREYLSQLLNLKTDSVSGYEQRIYREINELKQKHHHELEMSKQNLIDIYDKQIRFLRQALDQKSSRTEILQKELRQKSRQTEQMMIDTRSFHRKFDSDLSQARLSLKIKSEELDRINNIYQQTLGNLNAHKLQNQMLRQKLNCLKGEYYKADANSKDEMSSLKAQVAVLREQLANYQIIQKQIDEAVMSLGKINPNDNSIFMNTLGSAPTSSKRRIQQSLGLAQRLQAKQKDHEDTVELLRKREKQLQELRGDLAIARATLDKASQTNQMLRLFEQKQKQILMVKKENQKMEKQYRMMKDQHRQMTRKLDEADKDIKRLFIKRQSLLSIQKILVELARGSATSEQVMAAVDNIGNILGSTQQNKVNYQQQDRPEQSRMQKAPQWVQKLRNGRR